VLNAKESDDPNRRSMRWVQARSVGGGPAVAPHGTGAGDSGGGYDVAGGGSGRGMGAVGSGLLRMMQRFSQNSERLTIQQGDPEVTITNAAGQSNMVYTDGRVVESTNEKAARPRSRRGGRRTR
jgi:hypothetical protein